jgi:hypothetical protein
MHTEKHPYELLARWDETGVLKGAHVQWRTVTRDDTGKIVAEGVSDAEPINIGQGNGFPLADILSEVQIEALSELAKARSNLDEQVAKRQEAEAELARVKAERDVLAAAA